MHIDIYAYIAHFIQTILNILMMYAKTINTIVSKDNDTVWIVPTQVFYTTIGSIFSAVLILLISSLYNKRRERQRTIKERSEYEPFLYQYLTDIAVLSERQAELIDEYISHLEKKENLVHGLVHVPKTSVRYFLQIQPNVIYNSLFLNKIGGADERTKVYSAIIGAISALDGTLENMSENYKDFNLLYQSSINNLNMFLEQFHIFHDDVLANREEYLAGNESAFYLQLDKAITKQQTKEKETRNIYSSYEFCQELLEVCKPFHTKGAISLTRILINVKFRFDDTEGFRKHQILVFKQTADNFRNIGQDLRLAIQASTKMPLIK